MLVATVVTLVAMPLLILHNTDDDRGPSAIALSASSGATELQTGPDRPDDPTAAETSESAMLIGATAPIMAASAFDVALEEQATQQAVLVAYYESLVPAPSAAVPGPANSSAAPTPAAAPRAPILPTPEIWQRLSQCESGGNWQAVSASGRYFGGLQFTLSSWAAVGGVGFPNEAPPEEQIMRANLLWELQGWRAWPHCSRRLGLY